MKSKLTQFQRLMVAFIYIVIICILFNVLGGNLSRLLDSNYDISIWFYSGILLIIMGRYVTEPFFATPTDTLTNSLSLVLALLIVSDKDKLIGYYYIFGFAIIMLILSLITIFLKDKNIMIKSITYWSLKNIGSSKVIFSIVYLLSSYSYFANNKYMKLFVMSLTVWICIMFFDVVGLAYAKILDLKNIVVTKKDNEYLGIAIKCKNPNLYTIEIEKNSHNISEFSNSSKKLVMIKIDKNYYNIGIVVNCKILLDKLWLDICLITSDDNKVIRVKYSEIKNQNKYILISDKIGSVRNGNIESFETSMVEKINNSLIYSNYNKLIGYVERNSNINTINFSMLSNSASCSGIIKEGSIIATFIYGKEVLYQVIDGITKVDNFDSDSSNGNICGIARKLGVYNYDTNQLNIVEWIPYMFENVYICPVHKNVNLKEIADSAIGRLPETDMKIPIEDINSLVTHNTAILGILGVGKSCLTFELIKKVTQANIKVVCIDITNQYASSKGLVGYIKQESIEDDICDRFIQAVEEKSKSLTGAKDKPKEWGNVEFYKSCIRHVLKEFLTGDKKVITLNPDKHSVTKPASLYNITELADVSLVEKTKMISEILLKLCIEMGQTDTARCCMVYEEAHSLVPEWNSIVNSGDDRSANGTAKVILQGRKYGLGCFVVTQRTANVTKSILNQCNTIFALRIFDDTGKSFLENYIGKDYSDTLSTLKERHAIGIGKGLKLKQPIIIQLNDMNHVKEN